MTNATIKKNSAESAISAYTKEGINRSPPYPYIFLSFSFAFPCSFPFFAFASLSWLVLLPGRGLSRLGDVVNVEVVGRRFKSSSRQK